MRWMIAGSLLLAMLPVAVAGQSVGGGGTVGKVQPVKPCTLTQRVTYERNYGDGLSATGTTEQVVMRDAEGRTRSESRSPEMNPTKYVRNGRVTRMEEREERTSITVYDPVDRVSMNWTIEQGSQPQVRLNHMPKSEARAGAVGVARKATAEGRGGEELTAEVTTEKLGTRAIQGVIADGMRTTTKYSAGVFGMNREFTVVNETWLAVDCPIVLESLYDDPRSGKQVTTLVSFVAGDPDPAMFKLPPGAKVTETVQVANSAEKPEAERAVR